MTVRELYATGIFLHSDPVCGSDPTFFVFDEGAKQRRFLRKEDALDYRIEGIYSDGGLYIHVTEDKK